MEIFFQRSASASLASSRTQLIKFSGGGLTSGALGVLLDVLALLDELVLGGAGEATLRSVAELSSKARSAAGGLACSVHGEVVVVAVSLQWCNVGITSRSILEARLHQAMGASETRHPCHHRSRDLATIPWQQLVALPPMRRRDDGFGIR